jgi:hypothetical protein
VEISYNTVEVLNLNSGLNVGPFEHNSKIRNYISLSSVLEELLIEGSSLINFQLTLNSIPSDSDSSVMLADEPIIVQVPYVRPQPIPVVRIRPIRISRYGS